MASECTIAQGGLGSVLCDCGSQLRKAMQAVADTDSNNALLYSFGRGHEGRGVGVENHFRAYVLHTQLRLSSPEAYKALKIPVDAREYGEPIQILRELGLHERPFVLWTNSRSKRRALAEAGLQVERQGFEVEVTEHNAPQIFSRMLVGHKFSAAAKAKVLQMDVQLRTVEECQEDGLSMVVEPERIAEGVHRFGPVTLPLSINRADDDVVSQSPTYLYNCNGRMYHVMIGTQQISPEAEVAALPACIPGDNFASMRCNCRRQLRKVMGSLQSQPDKTVLIYALTHHSQDPHAKIPLDALRAHAFNGQHERTPMAMDHPDVQVILDSVGVKTPRTLVMK